jgi:CRISPR/Cas system Type II protein with McrA/HNH and RuvC-like nuclease domain
MKTERKERKYKTGDIYKTSKLIYVSAKTKERLGWLIQKGETWDVGISDILDFLKVDVNHDEFMLWKVMKQSREKENGTNQ